MPECADRTVRWLLLIYLLYTLKTICQEKNTVNALSPASVPPDAGINVLGNAICRPAGLFAFGRLLRFTSIASGIDRLIAYKCFFVVNIVDFICFFVILCSLHSCFRKAHKNHTNTRRDHPMLKRKIYDELLDRKRKSNGQTALLIDGARRVGKSYIAFMLFLTVFPVSFPKRKKV